MSAPTTSVKVTVSERAHTKKSEKNILLQRFNNFFVALAWRRGIVAIAYAYRTEDPWFESRQGVRFLGIDNHCSTVVIT
jgi:hypothetical protein